MKIFTRLPYPIKGVKRSAKLYNKAFHTKLFTLWASSESEIYTLTRLSPKAHYRFCLCFIKNFESNWLLDDRGLARVKIWILQLIRRQPQKILRIYRQWRNGWKRYVALSEKLLTTDLSKLKDRQLFGALENFYRLYQSAGGLAYLTDSFMSTGQNDWMETLLAKELKKLGMINNIPQTIRLLTFPLVSSFPLEEESQLGRLASLFHQKFHKNLPTLIQLANNYPRFHNKLLDHRQRYFWIKNNYYNVEFYDVAAIYKKLKKIPLEDYQTKAKQLHLQRLKHQCLVKRLPLNKSTKNLLKISQLFSQWKDLRKAGVYRGMHHFDQFLTEISRRKRLNIMDINFLTLSEIKLLFLKNKNFDTEIKARKKQMFFTFTTRGYYLAGGNRAERYFKLFAAGRGSRPKELHGVPASPGYAKGRVRVIRQTHQMEQFKTGQILVTNQTTPEFAPIMKKAAAIVTEQGGITSHAAIISRELHKPCVIGTKIATEVFKDGDLVEVNADKGTVTKIS